jgi:hypothetical protein
VDFSEARDLFVIIFQIPGSDCKFLDYGLILEKLRGLNEKMPEIRISRNYFPKGNPWTESTSPWTTVTPIHGGPSLDGGTELTGASTFGRSGIHGRWPRGGRGGVGRGECGGRLTGARAAVWRPSVEAAQWWSEKFDGEPFRRGRGEGRSMVGVECSGGPRGGFYRAGGGHRRGGRSNGGDEWLLRPLRLVKARFEGD